MSKKQYLRLQGYLYDLHTSGKVCIFSDFSGHVDRLGIRVTDSKKNYNIFLYGSYVKDEVTSSEYKYDYKKMVDIIIQDIEEAIKNRDITIEKKRQEREEIEKQEYERLSKKFNGKSDDK